MTMPRLPPIFLCLCALFLTSIASAQTSSHQPAPQNATSPLASPKTELFGLSAADQRHLLHDKFKIVMRVSSLPQTVQADLSWPDGYSDMANPGQYWAAGDTGVPPGEASRQLIFAAVNSGYCFLYYSSGGIGLAHGYTLYRLFPSYAAELLQSNDSYMPPVLQTRLNNWLPSVKKSSPTSLDSSAPRHVFQIPQALSISELDKARLLHDDFRELTTVARIPKVYRETLLGSSIADSMANPGQPYQDSSVVTKQLPWRRLIYAELAAGHCLVFYEHGGNPEAEWYTINSKKAVLKWRIFVQLNADATFQQVRQAIIGGHDLVDSSNYR